MASSDDRPAVPHYAREGGVEPIDVIRQEGWLVPFCKGNILKYTMRLGHKGQDRQDLLKIIDYAQFMLDELESGADHA